MTWRLLICGLIGLILSAFAHADTLVVAGYTQTPATPFVVSDDEVLAPVTPALRLLGASATRQGNAIQLTNCAGKTAKLRLGSTTMEAERERITLPVAPREVDGAVLLPIRALVAWLQADAVYQPDTQTLTIRPLLTVAAEPGEDGVMIRIRCAAPLQYTSGQAGDPPRVFFDFRNVAMAQPEQEIPVQHGNVERLRLAPSVLSPDFVRLVVDLAAPMPVRADVDEQGRAVTIAVGTKLPATVPTVASATTPRIVDLTLTPVNAQLSEFTIVADAPVQVASDFNAKTKQLTLSFANAVNAISPERLRQLNNTQVAKVEVSGSATTPGTTLSITLKHDAGYLIDQTTAGVQLLIGTFSLKDMLVVLDAGHGGYDSGAMGVAGTKEKDINLDVVLRTEKLLRQAGAKVMMTRADDTFIPLDNRPGLANAQKAAIFISVHCNSSAARNSCSGSQTYYRTPQSIALASAMHAELVKGTELKDGGIRNESFLVIRKSNMPSVLLELAFINNEREEKLLASPEFRQRVAASIVNGVRRYAGSKFWQLRRANLMPVTTIAAAPPAPAAVVSAAATPTPAASTPPPPTRTQERGEILLSTRVPE